MADRQPAKKDTHQTAKSATRKASKGFSDEERAAMRERARELRKVSRHGRTGRRR